MKEYIVYFTTLDEDHDKEWCHANSKQEAADNIQREHWNIDHIDLVEEL